MQTTKNCSKLKSGKCASPTNPQPLSNFRPQAGRRLGKSLCKACEQKYTVEHREEAIARSRKWHKENRDRRKQRGRLDLYGLTPEQHDAIFVDAIFVYQKGGCCAICGVHQMELVQSLSVDHCHSSGSVRGLLCHKCNRGLGLFNDDTERMTKAINYVLRSSNHR